jgi:hypothetical protein
MTVWMNNDKSLIITKYNIIRKNDSNVPTLLYFLLPTEYHGVDLTEFSANLFYQIPNGDVYNVVLDHEVELYKDHIKLTLPSATDFTKYAGDVMIKMVLTKVIDEVIYTLVTGECAIAVQGVRDYYDDPTPGTIEHIEEEIAAINARLDTTADNISLNSITNELYLTNAGLPIGTPITMEDLGDALVNANDEGLTKVIL